MQQTYFDHAATTPTDPRVFQALNPYFSEIYGNPASAHAYGSDSKKAVAGARKAVASLLGARPAEIVFTSGGTESNNTALKGIAFANRERGDHIIISSIEHDSVLDTCVFLEQQGFTITRLPVDPYGSVAPDDVRRAITDRSILISVMHANNEIGTVEPLKEIGRVARAAGVPFHTDAVQTFGHLPFHVKDLRLDLVSVSAHKIYGPKGVGALYVRGKIAAQVAPLLHGGSQEDGRRASTLNVPGIVGFGHAAVLARAEMRAETAQTNTLRERLIRGVTEKVPGLTLNGHPTLRLPGIVNVSIREVEGAILLQELGRRGIACSTGSSCHAPEAGPSHVLAAIGANAPGNGSLRFSFGRFTTTDDIDRLIEVLPAAVHRARALSEFLE